MHRAAAAILCLSALSSLGMASTYDVGPGLARESIGEVPWESLGPGDIVLIHWRPQPYREKWVIARQGTPENPIVVRGVPGPGGELPVIHGDGATTPSALNFWSETRGVIKIGGSNTPPDVMPRHIIIDGLEIRSARASYTFTDDGGNVQTYQDNASTIFVEKGENITVRNCVLHDSGNGLFVASSDSETSRDILIEGNHIFDNGNDGSIYEHNTYTAAIGITYQYNHFGPLRSGAGGNNLKDRSAGLVVRYNWIEGGNRQLDLVNGEDSVQIRSDPAYGETHVYGNILVEPEGAGNRQILHYGGDTGSAGSFRKGTLYLYNNTVLSYRTDRTTLMRLSTDDESCDARNNIIHLPAADGDTLSLLDTNGVLDWSHNWIEPEWRVSFSNFHGTFTDDGTSVEGTDPGFQDAASGDLHPAAGSPCTDTGALPHPAIPPGLDVTGEYRLHQAGEPRPDDGILDIGAYEYAQCVSGGTPDPVESAQMELDGEALLWTGLSGTMVYDVVQGDLVLLTASGGDFAASVQGCLASGTPDATAGTPGAPAAAAGWFYLVRAVDCGVEAGSYDTGAPSQTGSRDAEILLAPGACP